MTPAEAHASGAWSLVPGDPFDIVPKMRTGLFDVMITEPTVDELGDRAWAPLFVDRVRKWSLVFGAVPPLSEQDLTSADFVRGVVFADIAKRSPIKGPRTDDVCSGVGIYPTGWRGGPLDAVYTVGPPRMRDTDSLLLCMRIVEVFSAPGETIFDPFVRSGNVGRAAWLLGRMYFGITSSDAVHYHARRTFLATDRAVEMCRFAWYKSHFYPSETYFVRQNVPSYGGE